MEAAAIIVKIDSAKQTGSRSFHRHYSSQFIATFHKVIATIGQGITHLTPSRGFAAELAAACTVVIASGTGLPISTTQTLVGAVLGVGMARGIAALNLGVLRSIALSWIVTLPAGAILSMTFFFMFKAIFGF